jgi:hypothetical protein
MLGACWCLYSFFVALIVVGLILGSMVLSVVLLVQVRSLYSCLLVFLSAVACLLPAGGCIAA